MIYLANNVTSSIKLAFEIIFFSHFVKSFPSLGLCRAGQGRIQGCAGQGRGEYRVVQDRVGAYTYRVMQVRAGAYTYIQVCATGTLSDFIDSF